MKEYKEYKIKPYGDSGNFMLVKNGFCYTKKGKGFKNKEIRKQIDKLEKFINK